VLERELGGFGLWIASGGQTPLKTVRAILTRRGGAVARVAADGMLKRASAADWWRLLDALLLVAVHPPGRAP
jgi:hypothetical protein